VASVALRDPAEMPIMAPALQHGAPLVTGERRIESPGLGRVIWRPRDDVRREVRSARRRQA